MSERSAARILAIRPAVPVTVVDQEDLYFDFYQHLYRDLPDAQKLFTATGVRRRHVAWDPREHFVTGHPGLKERMTAWEDHVLAMGREGVAAVLDGVDRERVGSFTLCSCTGYAGPTPEMALAKEFGLRADLRRTFVGHMGCYAAFNALKVAMDSLAARPADLALVTSAEVCSVHLRPELTKEQVVVNGLFADGSVSLLMSAVEPDDDTGGPTILATHTETHYDTADAMTWRVEDDSFRMTLSPFVPLYLAEAIEAFVDRLLAKGGITRDDVSHWGVHPGGPKIIDLVGERLRLTPAELAPSWEILAGCGNCSSATILLILDWIMRNSAPRRGEYGVLMAFGPGLTMESALLRF
ncbi:MAG TPA: type III polyketide synthase [Pseudonocardiaceae bacterium]